MSWSTLSPRSVGIGTVVTLVLGGLAGAPAGAKESVVTDADGTQASHAAVTRKPTGGISDPGVRAAATVVEQSRAGRHPHLHVTGDRLRVEVLGTELRAAVTEQGGRIISVMPGIALADVPASHLAALEGARGVTWVRLPRDLLSPAGTVSPVPSPTPSGRVGTQGSEPLSKTGAAGLHARGITGAGVRVGIIDAFDASVWNSAAAAGELPLQPAGQLCLNAGTTCDIWASGERHGVAVAEIIKDMAPSAEIYLATVSTVNDLKAAVDYFAAQGVRIVNRSEAVRYDGPGNGTGLTDQVVSYAETRGITFVKSAGNTGTGPGNPGGYWRGLFADADGDNYLEFAPGDELLDYDCGFTYGLRWSDWGSARTDYDMYIYDGGTVVGVGALDQAAGADPIEQAVQAGDTTKAWYCTPGKTYQLAVYRYAAGGGSAGDVLEFMVKSAGGVQYSSNAGSAASPISDAANRGALAVGAVDPPLGTAVAPYSSQGPTNDGRMKPDLSAPSNFSSFSYGFFNGTSAATPVVTGGAALVLSANPALSAAGLAEALRSSVVDRGTPGPDNVFGTGELYFAAPAPPAPPPPPPPPPPPSITKPSSVRGLSVSGRPGARLRVVTWRTPTTGSAPTGYRIRVKKGRKTLLNRSLAASPRSFVLKRKKLRSGRLVVIVSAFNSAGGGPGAVRIFRVR